MDESRLGQVSGHRKTQPHEVESSVATITRTQRRQSQEPVPAPRTRAEARRLAELPRTSEDTQRRPKLALVAKVAVVALLGGTALILGPSHFNGSPVADDGELVVNGGFEQGLHGWRVNDPAGTSLTQGTPGRTGAHAATLLALKTGTVALNDARNTVIGTSDATTYAVSAWLRTTSPGVIAQLRIREVRAGKLVSTGGQAARLGGDWQQVTMAYKTATSGAALDLNVVGWNVPSGQAIQVDDVSMRQVGRTPISQPTATATPTEDPTTPAPSPTATATATEDPTPTATATTPSGGTPGGSSVLFRGQVIRNCLSEQGVPSCGAFLGAAVGANSSPTGVESQLGGSMGLHRTYWQAGQVAKAVSTARSDLADNRIPWISFKPGYSWSDMAAGKGDAWAENLAEQLKALNGPVWLAIYHEPENDGDITQWTAMQEHLAPIFHSTAPNVAYSIILTGYNQVFGSNPAYKLGALWPGDENVDIIGIDPYNDYGVVKNGKTIKTWTELKQFYDVVAPFAKAHHTHWAVAETGYTDAAAAKDPAWLTRGFTDLVSEGGIGFAYFDTSVNAYGSWPLNAPKLSAFALALNNTLRLP